jgi:hypothetical protein
MEAAAGTSLAIVAKERYGSDDRVAAKTSAG